MISLRLNDTQTAPNIIIWYWMRTILKLSGNELFLFAYIFTQTFDNVHKCYSTMSELEMWFGNARQTISRNVDNLVCKNYIIKECKQNPNNPIIKKNSYQVNIEYITQLCEQANSSDYKNFLDSYGYLLKQRFPEDGETIDTYLNNLMEYHDNKDIEICITVGELAKLIHNNTKIDSSSITDMLEHIQKEKQPKKNPEKDYIQKSNNDTTSETTQKKLFDEPKRKSKKALHNEWDVAKREMTHNFVYMRVGGNDELLKVINNFLDTDNGRSYTPAQWEQQLENLYKYGRTVERMIEGVKFTFMNNYRSLYIQDKTEVDMRQKLDAIDRYIEDECEGSSELKDLLYSYVTDTQKGKSFTLKQFTLALKRLSTIYPELQQKIESVELSYANGYAALAYPNGTNLYGKTIQQTQSSNAIDTDKKIEKIHTFIKEGYYQLCEGLEEALITYVTETEAGSSMTYTNFCIILDNLRLLCLDDSEKVTKVKLAIQNNSNKLATEDYAETAQLKQKLETREHKASSLDRSRKAKVMKAKNLHPNDEKLKNITF